MLSKLILVLFAAQIIWAKIPVWFNPLIDADTGFAPDVLHVFESMPIESDVYQLSPHSTGSDVSFKLEYCSRSGLFRVDSRGFVIVNAPLNSTGPSRVILVASASDDTGANGLVGLLVHILEELPHPPTSESKEVEVPNDSNIPEDLPRQSVPLCSPEYPGIKLSYGLTVGSTVFPLDYLNDDNKADYYDLRLEVYPLEEFNDDSEDEQNYYDAEDEQNYYDVEDEPNDQEVEDEPNDQEVEDEQNDQDVGDEQNDQDVEDKNEDFFSIEGNKIVLEKAFNDNFLSVFALAVVAYFRESSQRETSCTIIVTIVKPLE